MPAGPSYSHPPQIRAIDQLRRRRVLFAGAKSTASYNVRCRYVFQHQGYAQQLLLERVSRWTRAHRMLPPGLSSCSASVLFNCAVCLLRGLLRVEKRFILSRNKLSRGELSAKLGAIKGDGCSD